MTIETPAFFGLIARKNERTLAYIEQRRSRLMSAFREKDPDTTLEDVDRFSFHEALRSILVTAGWQVDGPEDWRDVGWVINASKGGASITVPLARLGQGDDWMLQIAPRKVIGLVARIFGGANSATPSDILAIAQEVHSRFSTVEGVSSMQWRWDGMPRDNDSTSGPTTA